MNINKYYVVWFIICITVFLVSLYWFLFCYEPKMETSIIWVTDQSEYSYNSNSGFKYITYKKNDIYLLIFICSETMLFLFTIIIGLCMRFSEKEYKDFNKDFFLRG